MLGLVPVLEIDELIRLMINQVLYVVNVLLLLSVLLLDLEFYLATVEGPVEDKSKEISCAFVGICIVFVDSFDDIDIEMRVMVEF
jgi:hypothetical protein